MALREIELRKVVDFQKCLEEVLADGPNLFQDNGLCQAIRYKGAELGLSLYLSYDILMHLLPRETYLNGMEEPGVFGPLRQTFAMMLMELTPKELFAMLNLRDQDGRFFCDPDPSANSGDIS